LILETNWNLASSENLKGTINSYVLETTSSMAQQPSHFTFLESELKMRDAIYTFVWQATENPYESYHKVYKEFINLEIMTATKDWPSAIFYSC